MAAKPRVKIPKTAKAGEIITIKTLISHKMESGQRKDKEGNIVPRMIINSFSCEFNGKVVFSCDIDPAVSTNPYFEFKARVDESGTFTFKWVDDNGEVVETSADIVVS